LRKLTRPKPPLGDVAKIAYGHDRATINAYPELNLQEALPLHEQLVIFRHVSRDSWAYTQHNHLHHEQQSDVAFAVNTASHWLTTGHIQNQPNQSLQYASDGS